MFKDSDDKMTIRKGSSNQLRYRKHGSDNRVPQVN